LIIKKTQDTENTNDAAPQISSTSDTKKPLTLDDIPPVDENTDFTKHFAMLFEVASQPPSELKAKALFDYEAATPDELTFKAGDIMRIEVKDSGGWWQAELNGKKGWIPANYVEEL